MKVKHKNSGEIIDLSLPNYGKYNHSLYGLLVFSNNKVLFFCQIDDETGVQYEDVTGDYDMNMTKEKSPFDPENQIRVFSNGTDYQVWQNINCHDCWCYESESTTEKAAKCKLAFNLDLASASDGTIPLWVCKEIGIDYDPLYGTGILYRICRKKREDLDLF